MSDGTEQTRTATTARSTTLLVRSAALSIIKGRDAGHTVKIDAPSFVIGTGASADLRLVDPAVSREHAFISLLPSGVRIRDRSKNGTWIGNLRVQEVVLGADTVITVGATSIAIKLEAESLALALSSELTFGDAFGMAPVMRHLFATLSGAAAADITVLLEGESGVGKDVLARAIHTTSARRDAPFVVVDCGTIPPNLIESELFGHVRGAFTGATEDRRGVFEEANGGTLFLDEIGELPLDMQPKLLRALESREIRPVGGKKTKKIDVRIVAATNKKLAEASRKGDFREDLYYRIAVARVTVPPLRDRPEDIIPLATRFLRLARNDATLEVPPDLAAMLSEYSFPGNVRELRNIVERWAVLGDSAGAKGLFDDTLKDAPDPDDLSRLPYHEARRIALERFEANYLPKVLERAKGVIARAAENAQVARPSFYRMLERLRLAKRED